MKLSIPKNLPWKQILLRPLFLAFFICAAFMPTVYCIFSYRQKSEKLDSLQEEYFALKPKIAKVLTNKNNEHTFLKLYANSDRFYTENHLEKMKFLSSEVKQLKFLANYSSFARCASLNNRLKKLSSETNRLRLSSINSHTSRLTCETQQKLLSPVEVDRDDLQKLLAHVEDVSFGAMHAPAGRPNLQLTRFSLTKQTAKGNRDTYLIDFDLIKREPASTKEAK